AKDAFQAIETRAREVSAITDRRVEVARGDVRDVAFRQLEVYRRRGYQFYSDVCHRTRDGLRNSSGAAGSNYTGISVGTEAKAANMKSRLPILLSQISSGAARRVSSASTSSRALITDIQFQTTDTLHAARAEAHTQFNDLLAQARATTAALTRQLPALLADV